MSINDERFTYMFRKGEDGQEDGPVTRVVRSAFASVWSPRGWVECDADGNAVPQAAAEQPPATSPATPATPAPATPAKPDSSGGNAAGGPDVTTSASSPRTGDKPANS